MESVGSNEPPPSTPLSPHRLSTNPRLSRAIHHRLLLLHRSGLTFHILGSTSNVYTIILSEKPSCSCPDPVIPCKHIFFVLLRVLRLPISHQPSLCRRSLRRSVISQILASPTDPKSLANHRVIKRFRQLFFSATAREPRGGPCPVCLEEMEADNEEVVVRCGICRNELHKECWERWKRIRGRGAKCVLCRARWRENKEAERYLNLGAVSGDDDEGDGYVG